MKMYLLIFSVLFIFSCGKDKLNSKITSSTSGLAAGGTCTCTSHFSPVCGVDGKNYDNSCQAQCQTTVASAGHCNCATNSIPVCGSDGLDHSECEALAPNSGITIVKYVPCDKQEQ